jgi:hypothetical protein
VLVFGAWTNAVAMTAPFEAGESRFLASIGKPAFIALFTAIALAAIPGGLIAICTLLSSRWARRDASKLQIAASFALALVPLGVGMWAAHFAFHTLTGFSSIVPTIQRAVAAATHSAAEPDWSMVTPRFITDWLTPLQLMLLDAGLLLTLYICWRISRERFAGRSSSAFATFLPWGLLALALYAGGAWILLQPMTMRGMMVMN